MKTKKTSAARLLTNGSSCPPNCEEIASRAYLLWEQQGCPAGRDLDHWLQVEAQLQPGRTPDAVAA